MTSPALKKASSDEAPSLAADMQMFVTMRVERQLLGIPVEQVRDVLKAQKVAPIPLAPPEVAGAFSLRGRIVTVIDLRQRLKLAAKDPAKQSVFVVVEHKEEFFGLMADAIGEALSIPGSRVEKVPPNVDANWREVAMGVHALGGELLMIADVHALLKMGA